MLVGAYMPCVLVETAFLSHPVEGRRLAQKTYRADVAEGLYTGIARFVRELSQFTGGFFTQEPPPHAEVRGDVLLLTRPTPEGNLHCEVERATLTPRRFYARDETGDRFELKMQDYQTLSGIPWPMRLEAISPMGRVIVQQRDVEINGELAPSAFVPPRRAEKRQ